MVAAPPLVWIATLVLVLLVVAGLLLARSPPKPGWHRMLPAGRGPHSHLVDLDTLGSGVSTKDMGHRHMVENVIDVGLARGGPAGHVHDVTAFIVDAPGDASSR